MNHNQADGDGYQDLVIGAHRYIGGVKSGALYIAYGSSSLSDGTPPLVYYGTTKITGDLGHTLLPAGDVDKDGLLDFVGGCPRKNRGLKTGYVVFGNPNRNSTSGINLDLFTPPSDVFLMINIVASDENFAARVAAGDVNGDGFSDFLFSHKGYDNDTGRILIVYGGPGLRGNSYNITNGLNSDKYEEVNGTSYLPPLDFEFGDDLWLVDLDNDGILELVVEAKYSLLILTATIPPTPTTSPSITPAMSSGYPSSFPSNPIPLYYEV